LVLQPMLIGAFYSESSGNRNCCAFGRYQFPAIQHLLEFAWKVVAFLVFVQAIIFAGTSVTIELGGFEVDLLTVARGGLAAFALALFVGMLFSALARVHYDKEMSRMESRLDEESFVMMDDPAHDDNRCCGIPKCLKWLLVFKSGVIATVLLIPVYVLPVVQFTADGVVANLLADPVTESTLFQLALGIAADSLSKFFGILIAAVFWITIVAFPLIALVTSLYLRLCRSWKDGDVRNSKPFHVLQFVFPFCSSAVFAIALVVAIVAMGKITAYLYDENQLCDFLNEQADEYCYIVYGSFTLGTWLLLAQSIATEFYAYLTLRDIENLPVSGSASESDVRTNKGILA